MSTTPRPRGRSLPSYAACAALLGGTYAFFVAMARFEPITGDGWGLALALHDSELSIGRLVRTMRAYHNGGNPRIGQLFTMLTYGSAAFHAIVTPLVLTSWPVLAVLHARGRWPSLGSMADVRLLLFAFAATWLAVPELGSAFMYRPVITNYTYSVVLFLAYFIPMRLDLRLARARTAVPFAVLMFAAGLIIGKLNEHVGPALVLAALASAALALRARRPLDALWRAAATLGVLAGFLLLFFAPGQQRRYGKLGQQSIWQTISERGFEGNLQLVASFGGYVAPLLLAMAVLIALYVALDKPRDAAPEEQKAPAEPAYWPLLYLLFAATMFGTAFAAPTHIERLFIAPAMLTVVAAVGALDRMGAVRAVRVLSGAGALVVHAAFIALCLDTYVEIHAGELERLALARAAPRRSELVVPPLPHARGSLVFFGDSLASSRKRRQQMAELYGVRVVRVRGD